MRVLFLCTGNSARSQIAEAVLRHLSHGAIEVHSAGSAPQSQVHPMARETVRRLLGDGMESHHPKHLGQFVGQRFDYVITVCDRAADTCPVFPGDPERIHWSYPDPAAVTGPPEAQQAAFDDIARQMLLRMRTWMALPKLRAVVEPAGR